MGTEQRLNWDFLGEQTPTGTFYYEITLDQDIMVVNRWMVIDCGCAQYALERNELLPQLIAIMQRTPRYTGSILNKKVKVITHALSY